MSFLFSPIAFQQCTGMGDVSHKSSQHSSFWGVYFNIRHMRMIKNPTKGEQEYAKRALQGAASQTSSFPLRSVIKLPEPDLQSPYSPREKSCLHTLFRPHRKTREGNSSLMEVKPVTSNEQTALDSSKVHPNCSPGCSFAIHIMNTIRCQLLK